MTALSGEDSPVYLRLRGTVAAGILRGDYKAGDQLPSVRALAAERAARIVDCSDLDWIDVDDAAAFAHAEAWLAAIAA